MKSLILKFSSLAALMVIVAAGAAVRASAQTARIQTTQLDALAAKASEHVDVDLDERMMQLTARFFSGKDEDEAKVKEIINGLKGIYVRTFEFASEGQYGDADLESIRSQLRNPAWSRVVNVNSKQDGGVEVYLMRTGEAISGLALLALEPKELTFINLIGPVDLNKLSDLEGQFGIPDLDLDRHPKPKRKN
jgi:Domain of unknown function (DUF4252)